MAALALAVAVPAYAQFTEPLSVPPPGSAATKQIPILKDVGLDQKPGAQVPLDIPLVDEQGHDVTLGQLFHNRPVILALVYYQCPMLCTEVLNGLMSSMNGLTFDAGKDFDVVIVSFDPMETPALAASKRQTYLERYSRPTSAAGVHFLTGREDAIHRLTSAVGFRYAYDAQIGQFAHPSLLTVLSPSGKVSRYLFGIEYPVKDLRLALVEASNNKIGSVVDQALLFCYHYDPATGRYGLVVLNLVRLGGAVTVLTLGVFLFVALRSERRRAADQDAHHPAATGTR